MIITRTPFRISFFGGGTDYPVWFEKHGGVTLSTTIDKYCYITCRRLPPFFDHRFRLVWSKIELTNHAEEIEHPTAREALKYLGFDKGVEIHHAGDLPARAGLGSSSTFVVGLLNALYALKGESISKQKLAMDGIHIEQERLNSNVGCQDHVAAAFGGLNKVTYGGQERFLVQPVSVSGGRIHEFQNNLMLFFTGLARNASDIAEQQIKNTPHKEKELHAMADMVDKGISLLQDESRPLEEFGSLLNETWQLKKKLSPVITTSHLDDIYDRARNSGAIGGKLLGAGGGGFMLLYAKPEDQPRVKLAMGNLLQVPFRFENSGSRIIYHTDEPNIA
jgi:D-glycero-alpha-D-manno-heptose-7-phosphate kinase